MPVGPTGLSACHVAWQAADGLPHGHNHLGLEPYSSGVQQRHRP
jgi:hypothetical protein